MRSNSVAYNRVSWMRRKEGIKWELAAPSETSAKHCEDETQDVITNNNWWRYASFRSFGFLRYVGWRACMKGENLWRSVFVNCRFVLCNLSTHLKDQWIQNIDKYYSSCKRVHEEGIRGWRHVLVCKQDLPHFSTEPATAKHLVVRALHESLFQLNGKVNVKSFLIVQRYQLELCVEFAHSILRK